MSRTMLLAPIAAASLKNRWAGFAGSFVALALGVTLTATAGMSVLSSGSTEVDPQAPSLHKLLVFSAGASAFIGAVVVGNTFAFAAAQRRRETAMLRALGATPQQVRTLIAGEALLVAALAAVAGCLAALLLAPAFAAWLVHLGAAPPGFHAAASAGPLVVAALLGLLVALAGALAASLPTAAVRPAEATADAAADRSSPRTAVWIRWIVIVHQIGGGVFLVVVYLAHPAAILRDPGMRGPDIDLTWAMVFDLIGIATFVLLTPLVAPPLVRLMTLPTRGLRSAVGLLARQNALTARRRTVSTVAPVFVVVATAGCVTGGVAAFSHAWNAQVRSVTHAGYIATGRTVTPQCLADLREHQGMDITAVTPFTLTDPTNPAAPADFAGGPVVAAAVDGDPRAVWNLPVGLGSVDRFHGPVIAVSADLAKAHGWHLGDRLVATTDADAAPFADADADADAVHPPVDLTVIATFPPTTALPEALVPASAVPTGGLTAPADLYAATPYPGLGFVPAAKIAVHRSADRARIDRITMIVIAGPALLYALIAVVNTMVMSTRDRLRDFAVLRRTGSTRGQILGMVAAESSITVAVAGVLGTAVSMLSQLGTTAMIRHDVPGTSATPLSGMPWTALSLSIRACAVLAALAALLPAARALRKGAL